MSSTALSRACAEKAASAQPADARTPKLAIERSLAAPLVDDLLRLERDGRVLSFSVAATYSTSAVVESTPGTLASVLTTSTRIGVGPEVGALEHLAERRAQERVGDLAQHLGEAVRRDRASPAAPAPMAAAASVCCSSLISRGSARFSLRSPSALAAAARTSSTESESASSSGGTARASRHGAQRHQRLLAQLGVAILARSA